MAEAGENNRSFLSGLLKKLSYTKQVETITGKPTTAAQREVDRQIHQAIRGGNPTKGEGVTKSGGEEA